MDKSMQIAIILTAMDNASAVINSAAQSSMHSLNEFQEKTEKMSNSAFKLGRESGELALGAGELLREPMKAFSEMQEASDSLQADMMQAGGATSKMFGEMNEKATQLGEDLPGTVSEVKQMFSIMLHNGESATAIMEGAGKSIDEFAAVTHQSMADAATSIMHLKNAAGIADEDMGKFTDSMARLNNLGAESGDLESIFAKSSQQLKALGLQGAEATNSVSTLFATFLRQGMKSKQIGGGLSDVLDKLYDSKKMQEFTDKASTMGLNLEFVDKKTGQFKGIENMVAQFDKIKQANLDTQTKKDLVSSLFGDGSGANIALGLIDGGIDSYNKAQQAMNSQATVSQKAQFLSESVANKWKSAWKKFEETLAGVGAKLLPLIESLIKKFVAVTEKIQAFISKHPTLIAYLGKALAIFAAVAASVSILSFVFGGAMKALSILSGGLKTGIAILKGTYSILRTVAIQGVRFLTFAYNLATSSVARLRVAVMLKNAYMKAATVVSKIYAGALNIVKFASAALAWGQKLLTAALGMASTGFMGVKTAIQATTTAMKANPIILIITIIATLAMLVIENWDKVKKFFVGLWNAVKKIFSAAWEWLKKAAYKYSGIELIVKLWKAVKEFFVNLWENTKKIFSMFWEWLKEKAYKYSGVEIIIKGWKMIKEWFSKLWENVKGIFTRFFDWLKGIPKRMFEAGKNMIKSIWDGIKSMAMKPVQAIKDMVTKIRKFLPFSPAKEGPLMDIHKIRLVETIADAVKPNSLVDKMKRVAAAALVPLQPILQVAGVPTSSTGITPSPSASASGNGGGSVQIHYNPIITMPGGGAAGSDNNFADILKKHAKEIEKIVNDAIENNKRVKLA